MKNVKNYAGIPYLYRRDGQVSTVIEIRMKNPVIGKYLQAAMDFTAARHPYFKNSSLEQNGDFYLVSNELPFEVSRTKQFRQLGSKEVNFHLIDVTYWENKIFVAFHHALCDGRGVKRFVETLLCYYCEFTYNIRADGSEGTLPTPGDTVDAFCGDFYPVEDVSQPIVQRDGYALPEVDAEAGRDGAYIEDFRYEFDLDQESFMRAVKATHATPAIKVALLVAEAIAAVHEDAMDEKPIICSMASDHRQALGADTTFKNTVNSVNLAYTKELSQRSETEKVEVFRTAVKEQKEPNYIRASTNKIIGLFRMLETLPDYDAKKAMMKPFDDIFINTFVLSYMGQMDLPDCIPFIDSMHLYSGNNKGLIVNMMAVGTSITVDFLQSFENQCYAREFARLLEKENVQFTASGNTLCDTPTDAVQDTEAMESNRESKDGPMYQFVRELQEKVFEQ